MKKIFLILLIFCTISCNKEIKNEIKQLGNTASLMSINLAKALRDAQEENRDYIVPSLQQAQKYNDMAYDLFSDKSKQRTNEFPYKKLNKKELLDSLRHLSDVRNIYMTIEIDNIERAYYSRQK
jgi:hypothetical protein